MVNWTRAKHMFQKIISNDGVWIYVLERVTSGSDAYNTGSMDSYGYGDDTTYWTTGSARVLMKQMATQDVILEVGFTYEDYNDMYYNPDTTINQWNVIIYPTGSNGQKYLVLPTQDFSFEESGVIVTKHALVRRLFPKSGSAN
jgi:hypothetical protein